MSYLLYNCRHDEMRPNSHPIDGTTKKTWWSNKGYAQKRHINDHNLSCIALMICQTPLGLAVDAINRYHNTSKSKLLEDYLTGLAKPSDLPSLNGLQLAHCLSPLLEECPLSAPNTRNADQVQRQNWPRSTTRCRFSCNGRVNQKAPIRISFHIDEAYITRSIPSLFHILSAT